MNRRRAGRVVASVAACASWVTAAFHATGLHYVETLAEQASPVLRAAVPALWLAFGIDLAVIGLIVAAVAARPNRTGPLILAFAALCPLSGATLQVVYTGFVPPTALLLAVAVLTLAAAALLRSAGPAVPSVTEERRRG